MTTYAPQAHLRRPHAIYWLVAAAAVAIALVALGVWLFAGRSSGGDDTAGAESMIVTKLQNNGDAIRVGLNLNGLIVAVRSDAAGYFGGPMGTTVTDVKIGDVTVDSTGKAAKGAVTFDVGGGTATCEGNVLVQRDNPDSARWSSAMVAVSTCR